MFIAAVIVVGVALAVGAGWSVLQRRRETDAPDSGLTIDQIERLRRAELALAGAPTPAVAARELGKHAMALLGAPAALVLIEDVGGTVRVEVGDATGHSLYGPGSRMRLLADDGVPIGSIAVAPNPTAPYDERDERILDALGERVSSTVHRLSLFDAVKAEQRTLADILSSSSDGIVSVGPDGRVRQWNPAMATLTGVPESVAVSQSCCMVFRPVDEAGVALHGAACPCRRGEPADVLVHIDVEGRARWLNCSYSPMSDGGSVIVARDVTARKEIEDEKADFLATVSHELRTPLTPIKGFLQTLLRSDLDLGDDDRRHIYEVMLREEQRLERMVDQLLQATTLDLTSMAVEAKPSDWTAIVETHVDEARRLDPSRELSLLIEPELPTVLVDAALAGGVLVCLLSNAVKYTPPGTDIGVAVACDGERVVTTVADRGPGVPAADRDRIFDKFIRLGDHLTRPQQGVGLGLYIARRSIEAMGGTVWVEDAAGGGAAFSFSLPVAPQAATRRRPLRSSSTS